MRWGCGGWSRYENRNETLGRGEAEAEVRVEQVREQE